jgi:hypothetical protein
MKGRLFLIISIVLVGLLAVSGFALVEQIRLLENRGGTGSQIVRLVQDSSLASQTESGDDRGMSFEAGDDHGMCREFGDDSGGSVSTTAPAQTVDDKSGLRSSPNPVVQPDGDYGYYGSY